MITYDPKNWIRILLDFPRSPVFRTLGLDVVGAGIDEALVVWVETDLIRVAVPLGPAFLSIDIKQFVMLYALVMPFGLVREFGYGTVIACMFTFFATMGLELLATEIEEPFGTDINDLPLDTLTGIIARDVGLILAPASDGISPVPERGFPTGVTHPAP